MNKPDEKDVPEDRWEDEGGPVQREVLPPAVKGRFTREEVQDAIEAPMKQGLAEYGA